MLQASDEEFEYEFQRDSNQLEDGDRSMFFRIVFFFISGGGFQGRIKRKERSMRVS